MTKGGSKRIHLRSQRTIPKQYRKLILEMAKRKQKSSLCYDNKKCKEGESRWWNWIGWSNCSWRRCCVRQKNRNQTGKTAMRRNWTNLPFPRAYRRKQPKKKKRKKCLKDESFRHIGAVHHNKAS